MYHQRMRQQLFGSTELNVSALGFGAAPIGYLGTSQTDADRLLNTLLDHGINVFDTAACYPGSEEAIGKALSVRRNEVVLISKCGHVQNGLPGAEWSAELITATVDQAQRRMRTDCLDAMLLHSCSLDVLQRGEALEALRRAKEAGKIRNVGYSGDNEAATWAAAQDDVSVLQISINICDQHNIDTVLPIARKRNVAVMAKRPIANAAWKPLTEQRGIYSSYARTYTERLARMNIAPATIVPDEHPTPGWAELALRFPLSLEGVHTAIIGTTNVDHALANIAAVEKGPLPAASVQRLRDAFREGEAASDEHWTGET